MRSFPSRVIDPAMIALFLYSSIRVFAETPSNISNAGSLSFGHGNQNPKYSSGWYNASSKHTTERDIMAKKDDKHDEQGKGPRLSTVLEEKMRGWSGSSSERPNNSKG